MASKHYNKSLYEGVPKKKINRSRFELNHEYKAMGNQGTLMPVLTMECLPFDQWDINTEFSFKFNPLYFPIMQKITMRADYVYCPNRILWPYTGEDNLGWSKWIAEDSEQTHPHIQADMTFSTDEFQVQTLAWMGIPLIDVEEGATGADPVIEELNALPLSAYLKFWDEYIRNPQLEVERWFPLVAGANSTQMSAAFQEGALNYVYPLFESKWEMDYFTSALPEPQIDGAVQIPLVMEGLGADVPGVGGGYPVGAADLEVHGPSRWRRMSDQATAANVDLVTGTGDNTALTENGSDQPLYLDIQETAGTIRQLRRAEILQEYRERIMKVGKRYRDFIKGLWGGDPTPMAVDVPVLIGSKFGRVQISDTLTTADLKPETGPQVELATGNLRGNAYMYSGDNDRIRYETKEHGWILCILQLNANTSYGQGIHRKWRRNLQQDYALDMFSTIGDQEILKEEVIYNPVPAQEAKNFETFGYIPRFAEYKYMNDIFIGNLAMDFGGLQVHQGRMWNLNDLTASGGTLYDQYIEINEYFVSAGYDKIGGHRLIDTFRLLPSKFATVGSSTQGQFWMHLYHSIKVDRCLPFYSTPKLT